MGKYDGQDLESLVARRSFWEDELKRTKGLYDHTDGKSADFYDGSTRDMNQARQEITEIDGAMEALKD